jgi:hypothetical protein
VARRHLSSEVKQDKMRFLRAAEWLREEHFHGRNVNLLNEFKKLGVVFHVSNFTLWAREGGMPLKLEFLLATYMLLLSLDRGSPEGSQHIQSVRQLFKQHHANLNFNPKIESEIRKLFQSVPETNQYAHTLAAHIAKACLLINSQDNFNSLPVSLLHAFLARDTKLVGKYIDHLLSEHDRYLDGQNYLGEFTRGIYDVDGESFISTNHGLESATFLDWIRSDLKEDLIARFGTKISKLIIKNVTNHRDFKKIFEDRSNYYSDAFCRFNELEGSDNSISLCWKNDVPSVEAPKRFILRKINFFEQRSINDRPNYVEYEIELHLRDFNSTPLFRLVFNWERGHVDGFRVRLINLYQDSLEYAFVREVEISEFDFNNLANLYPNECRGESIVQSEKTILFLRNSDFKQTQIRIPILFSDPTNSSV